MLMSVGFEHVAHAGHRADRRRALVDRVVGDVRVRVDDARRDELAGAVIDVGARRDLHVRADRGDLAVADHDRAVVDGAARDGDDRRVADGGDARLCGLPPSFADRCESTGNTAVPMAVNAMKKVRRYRGTTRPPGGERRDCSINRRAGLRPCKPVQAGRSRGIADRIRSYDRPVGNRRPLRFAFLGGGSRHRIRHP